MDGPRCLIVSFFQHIPLGTADRVFTGKHAGSRIQLRTWLSIARLVRKVEFNLHVCTMSHGFYDLHTLLWLPQRFLRIPIDTVMLIRLLEWLHPLTCRR